MGRSDRDLLETIVEVPVSQLVGICFDDRRLMSTRVIGVMAVAVMIVMVFVMIVMTMIMMVMDVRMVAAAMVMIDRAHDSAGTLHLSAAARKCMMTAGGTRR